MLVGPVFSAGSVTSERERETLDLLLTTTITPWQILWGKLIVGLRISSVLTLFLVWPLFLAVVMVSYYWHNFVAVLAFMGIILLTCLTTAQIALFCSVLFHKTVTSLMTTYATIICLFGVPLAVTMFAKTFMIGPDPTTAATEVHQPDSLLGRHQSVCRRLFGSAEHGSDGLRRCGGSDGGSFIPQFVVVRGAYLATVLVINAGLFWAMIRPVSHPLASRPVSTLRRDHWGRLTVRPGPDPALTS